MPRLIRRLFTNNVMIHERQETLNHGESCPMIRAMHYVFLSVVDTVARVGPCRHRNKF